MADNNVKASCMASKGYTQGGPTAVASVQPPPAGVAGEREEIMLVVEHRYPGQERALRSAQIWLAAQKVLDGEEGESRRASLFKSLCRTGDASACLMAGVRVARD